MKIIKPGKQLEPINFECPVCGCKFTAETKECEIESKREYWDLTEETTRTDVAMVKCPCCNFPCRKKIREVTE